MAKTIELLFTNTSGKISKLTVDSPKEPIDPLLVKQVMDQIIAANVFSGTNGDFVSAAEARLVEHNVTDYELV
ncbi:DUF2922 domain-containing protein [Bacillus benzoevorans]|uniref:DUF2922 domain-containing protein n=1 Tax=Bacillus benzoevorans TaxID=1456 RepID=A0A7X0LXW8_9BACI|nr:DUF2922 domain-containing protein [Bacillus benzoevorans]MBB6446849.1 hypothetical protein [Bacillus benzoevorans]